MENQTNKNNELELVERINNIARSEFELIVVDSTTRIAYQRNTDFEWAGGELYNPLGQISQENMQKLHPRIHIEDNFWEEIKDCRWVPCITIYNNPRG